MNSVLIVVKSAFSLNIFLFLENRVKIGIELKS
jgi:hypothetical protein